MCDLSRVHADIVSLSHSAAEMAFDHFGEGALDDYVIRSAVRQAILNLGDVPESILADAITHTRQFIEQSIKGETQ